ncbi:MAG: insulinase family protein [Bacteriovoracaceae bacterium]|nr:insulinase family protein [Bacteriovoracaceae bacterium]
MTPELVKLRNKLSVIFMQSPGAKAACVQMWFRAGSSLETPAEHGIAHFLEHMFFKGTAKYPGAKLTQALEESGAEVNAFTSYDYTCYYINTPNRDLLKNTAILLDMVAHPLFPPEDFGPERQVVLEELHRSLDDPKSFAMYDLRQNFLAAPYQHPILGKAKNIKKFSRPTLLNFRKKHYNVQNAFLIVAGDFDRAKITKLIASFKLPAGKTAPFAPFKLKKTKNFAAVHFKDTPMGMLHLVKDGSPYGTPLAAQEELAWSCLTEGESSPLYQALVREKNIANSVAGYTNYYQQGSCHTLRVIFPWDNFAQVLQTIKEIFTQALEKGLREEDRLKVLQQDQARKIYRTETLENFAFDLGENFALTQDLKAEDAFYQVLQQTTLAEINQAVAKIMTGWHGTLQIPQTAANTANEATAISQQALQKMEQLAQNLANLKDTLRQDNVSILQNIRPLRLKEDPSVRLYPLAAGWQYLHLCDSSAASFSLRLTFNGGQSLENTANSGITNLLSNTITKGHGKWASNQIDQFLEAHSAALEATCTRNSFSILLHGQSMHYVKLTNFLLEMLQSPTFPEKFTTQEKELALRQLVVQANDPVRRCMIQMNKKMFLDHPYQENLLGNPESLAAINTPRIKELWQYYVQQAPLLICGGGMVDEKDEANFLAKLGEIFPARAQAEVAEKAKQISSSAGDEFYFLDREQQHILFAVPIAPYFAPENLALRIFTTCLSGQSSRLFQRMRDELGLCYAVQPLHYSLLEGGFWGIYIGCGVKRAAEARQAMQEFWQDLQENVLTPCEFAQAKTMLQGQRDLELQTEDDFAAIYSFAVLHQRPLNDYFQQNMILQKMSYAEFKKLIGTVLARPLAIVRTGGQG